MAKPEQAKAQPRFSGRTTDVRLTVLNAKFWEEGKSIIGSLRGWRETSFTETNKNGGPSNTRKGIAYQLDLQSPVLVDGVETSEVELSPLAGLVAAFKAVKENSIRVNAARPYNPQKGDIWQITCTNIKRATREDFSDSPEFSIDVL